MDHSARNAVARSKVYALLARGFRYPTVELLAAISNGNYFNDLAESIPSVRPDLVDELAALRADLRGSWDAVETFESEYLKTFETGLPEPILSLYESAYMKGSPRAEILLELNAFYQSFGLAMNATFRELEDGLTAELEFMQFLTAKEAQVIEEKLELAPYLLAQRDFLTRHLTSWLPTLEQRAVAGSAPPFYRALIRFTRLFVERERDVANQAVA
jgi:putative dimethyl sulfoxide reductase chaperone